MPSLTDHGVGTVGGTLGRLAWMNMDVGNDRQAARFADRPEIAEVAPIEPDNAAVKRVRVEIIIEHKVHVTRSAVAFAMSK